MERSGLLKQSSIIMAPKITVCTKQNKNHLIAILHLHTAKSVTMVTKKSFLYVFWNLSPHLNSNTEKKIQCTTLPVTEMLNEESSCCIHEYISLVTLKQVAFYINYILPNILL